MIVKTYFKLDKSDLNTVKIGLIKKNWKLHDLANALNLTYDSLIGILHGRTYINKDCLKKMEDVLCVKISLSE